MEGDITEKRLSSEEENPIALQVPYFIEKLNEAREKGESRFEEVLDQAKKYHAWAINNTKNEEDREALKDLANNFPTQDRKAA